MFGVTKLRESKEQLAETEQRLAEVDGLLNRQLSDKINELAEARAEVERLRSAFMLVLDQVDYTSVVPGCRVNEMVGAVLPKEILERARKALEHDPPR